MALPFGFSAGDFIAVGQLIQKITVELRENGEAAPEYQHLLIELEALDRALKQIQSLQPKKHELLQLTAIRATALTCQIPLQQFLNKISKFDQRLSIANVEDQRFRGFHRRMQWRLVYKDEVKALRAKLGSHVATISLLLMTQAVSSITTAEHDRAEATCGLQAKILAHRRLLEDVQTKVDSLLSHQLETKGQLERQADTIGTLDRKADQTTQQLHDEHNLIQEFKSIAMTTGERTRSILAIATETLSQATQGLLTLRDIAIQLYNLAAVITKFTVETQESIALLMRQFARIYSILHILQGSIATRICPPIVQFTDALGETLALPYQICLQWKTFRLMLNAIFEGRPGKSRVERGNFLIMHAAGGRRLLEDSWTHAIRGGDHLQMSIVLDDLLAEQDFCPFPSCKASLLNAEASNGGKTCPRCSRWVLLNKTENPSSVHTEVMRSIDDFNDEDSDEKHTEEEMSGEENSQTPLEEMVEDIELYRNISVMTTGVQRFEGSTALLGFSTAYVGTKLDTQQPYNASAAAGSAAMTPTKEIWKTISGTAGTEEFLDPRFRIHESKDFEPGKVFKVLWSAPQGENVAQTDNMTEVTRFTWDIGDGECKRRAYTSIRRFVIITAGHGCAQCLPIHTYHGLATMKHGVKREDHAIIYTGDKRPKKIKGEKLQLHPIQVIPRTPRDKLEEESRINYAKIYTVEHNVKVLFIGRVAPSSQYHLHNDFDATWMNMKRRHEESVGKKLPTHFSMNGAIV